MGPKLFLIFRSIHETIYSIFEPEHVQNSYLTGNKSQTNKGYAWSFLHLCDNRTILRTFCLLIFKLTSWFSWFFFRFKRFTIFNVMHKKTLEHFRIHVSIDSMSNISSESYDNRQFCRRQLFHLSVRLLVCLSTRQKLDLYVSFTYENAN